MNESSREERGHSPRDERSQRTVGSWKNDTGTERRNGGEAQEGHTLSIVSPAVAIYNFFNISIFTDGPDMIVRLIGRPLLVLPCFGLPASSKDSL